MFPPHRKRRAWVVAGARHQHKPDPISLRLVRARERHAHTELHADPERTHDGGLRGRVEVADATPTAIRP
jgi:hypothetical protein